MSDILKNLALDSWYKVFIVLGAGLFLYSIFVETHGLTNKQVSLFGLSLFFVGIGEWKNHKVKVEIKPPNAYVPGGIYQWGVRSPDLVGYIFVFLGIIIGLIFLIPIIF